MFTKLEDLSHFLTKHDILWVHTIYTFPSLELIYQYSKKYFIVDNIGNFELLKNDYYQWFYLFLR